MRKSVLAVMAVALMAWQPQVSEAGSDKLRKEKDESGKEWALTDWKEGERPYKKDLAQRETEYKKNWGESWRGPLTSRSNVNFIMTPGVWKGEEFVVIPDSRKASPGVKGGKPRWDKSQANVFAPGGGEEVSAVWSVTFFGIYHVDARTKRITFAGAVPDYTYEGGNIKIKQPLPESVKDGLDDQARLRPARSPFGNWLTVDPVTGRVYFTQRTQHDERGKAIRSPNLFRYAEELRPYTVGGKEMLLPAILDYKEMYKKVGAEPVMKDGKRAPARIAVRTTPIKLDRGTLPSRHYWGAKVVLSADGRVAYFDMKSPGFSEVHAFEIDTGKDLGAVPSFDQAVPPGYIADAHAAVSGNYDGRLYGCFHPGCGQGPGRLFSVDLKTGKVTRLYDSLIAWPGLQAGASGAGQPEARTAFFEAFRAGGRIGDGPADAISLNFVTTCFQTACPRTGAIINGGWDASGLRRYHDGFLTSLVQATRDGPRPELKGFVVDFMALQSCPDVAPDGSVWMTDSPRSDPHFKGDKLRLEGTRIVRMWRTDWPKEQPVNGFANRFVSQQQREELMLNYCKKYIANYEANSKF